MDDLILAGQLALEQCPHCGVNRPSLTRQAQHISNTFDKQNERYWRMYDCARCGGVVVAAARAWNGSVEEYYPSEQTVAAELPTRAREYLRQAKASVHAPAGSIMLSASSVDAMLKDRGYKKGSLKSRIREAAEDHLITDDMAQWAHDVRLDANDQRHADEDASLPTPEDAGRVVDFVIALGDLLYVLPARVRRGLKEASYDPPPQKTP